MDQLEELEKTFLEEYEAAGILLQREMVKSATILLSKSLFALNLLRKNLLRCLKRS